jgi:hypothetical protein
MNPNQTNTEKGIQTDSSDSNKKSRTTGSPELNYLARCRALSDHLVTSDERGI